MQWVEAIVHTTTEGSDLVSDLLMRCGAMGTQVLDRADAEAIGREKKNWELFDANIVRRMPEDVQVKGWFAQDDRHNLIRWRSSLRRSRRSRGIQRWAGSAWRLPPSPTTTGPRAGNGITSRFASDAI
jgi:ribosomal protein L11 methylase PrmA